MKFLTSNNLTASTHLVGYIKATREEIETIFGKPAKYGEGSKVTTEWGIEFEDGTVATIYDWKRYEEGEPALDEVYDWHIGGADLTAVSAVGVALDRSATVFVF